MALEKEVVECLKKSLKDVRCIGAITHLEEILKGYDNAGDEYGRVTDKDGAELKTIDDIIGKIAEDDIELRRVRVRKERFYNSLSGVRITLKNIIVEIKGGKAGDNSLAYEFGIGKKNLVFVLSYFADNDADVPIKINYLDLVDYEEEDEDEHEDK